MEEKMISEMTARQHKAEVRKCAHGVNCSDLVMLEKRRTTVSTVVLWSISLACLSAMKSYNEVEYLLPYGFFWTSDMPVVLVCVVRSGYSFPDAFTGFDIRRELSLLSLQDGWKMGDFIPMMLWTSWHSPFLGRTHWLGLCICKVPCKCAISCPSSLLWTAALVLTIFNQPGVNLLCLCRKKSL